MTYEKLRRNLVGPCTAPATPFRKDLSIDDEGLRSNVEHILDGGFRRGRGWIMAATAGGEGPFMTIAQRKRTMEICADQAGGRIPLEASVASNSYETVLDLARHAKNIGCDVVQVPPPWYHGTSEDEVVRFYEDLTSAVEIPVIAINAYWLRVMDGAGYNESTLGRLAAIDGVVGIKWSSPNWFTWVDGIRKYGRRFAFSDNSFLGLGCLWGCTSFIDVLAQVFPEYVLQYWDTLRTKDFTKANAHLWRLGLPYYLWLGRLTREGIHGEGPLIKAALWLSGRPAGPTLRPYDAPISNAHLRELRRVLLAAGVPGVVSVKDAQRARLAEAK